MGGVVNTVRGLQLPGITQPTGTDGLSKTMADVEHRASAPQSSESQYLQYVNDMAHGKVTGPDLAGLQLQQGLSQATNQAQALAASQRGISPALAARMAAESQSQLQHQANMGAAQLKMQQQLQMQQQGASLWGDQINSIRGYNQAHEANQTQKDMQLSAQQHSGLGGLIGAAGAALMLNKGGKVPSKCDVPHMFDGGMMMDSGGGTSSPPSWMQKNSSNITGALSSLGKSLSQAPTMHFDASNNWGTQGLLGSALGGIMGKTPGMSGGGDAGGLGGILSAFASAFDKGGQVPGEAQVSGDSLKNDQVPAMLSPGEVVLPRSVVNSDNAGEKAKAFVEAIKRKHAEGKKTC